MRQPSTIEKGVYMQVEDWIKIGVPTFISLLSLAFGYGKLTSKLAEHEKIDKERFESRDKAEATAVGSLKEKIESEREKVKAIHAAVETRVIEQNLRIDTFVQKIDKAMFEEDGRSRFVSRQMCRDCREEYQGNLCRKIDELKQNYGDLGSIFSEHKDVVKKQLVSVQSYIALTGPILQALFSRVTEGGNTASMQTSCDITALFANLINEKIRENKESKTNKDGI